VVVIGKVKPPYCVGFMKQGISPQEQEIFKINLWSKSIFAIIINKK